MGINRDYFHQEWIQDMFKDHQFTVEDTLDIEWQLGEKISEKGILYVDSFEEHEATAEAVAVYNCTQVRGPEVGKEVIVKMRLQVPPMYPASPKSKVRKMFATKQLSLQAYNEMYFLKHLAEKGSKSYMPVPGGWMVLIIMEKLPGVPLDDFWEYSPEKRKKIRGAFRESLMELYSLSISPMDTHRGNVLYDEEENKCWFIDYEEFYIMKNGVRRKFRDYEYVTWNMASYDARGEVVFN